MLNIVILQSTIHDKIHRNMTFKRWTETNPEALKELKPDLGFRPWSKLLQDDKSNMWAHLEEHFFNRYPQQSTYGKSYRFYGDISEQERKRQRIISAIARLNLLFMAKSYGQNSMRDPSPDNACLDFYLIFSVHNENVVLELLSLYSEAIIREDIYPYSKEMNQSDEEFKEQIIEWRWEEFDYFSYCINNVFSHFGLNVYLTRSGFVPRQEDKIVQEIYDPVLKSLSHPQWSEVNKLLSDAFLEYRANTPQGFSNSVTNTVAAIQAFLQILVNGKTGKGEIKDLIREARKQSLVPSDSFTEKIFKDLEAVLMKERQETSVAHPKKEYATDKNARLVLNLAMVFLQHCIQN